MDNRAGLLLSQDAEPTPLLGEGWSVVQVNQSTHTIMMERNSNGQLDHAILDVHTLETIALFEGEPINRLTVERNGEFLLVRDANTGFARLITPARDTLPISDDLDCRELTHDGRLICQQGPSVVLYDPSNDEM